MIQTATQHENALKQHKAILNSRGTQTASTQDVTVKKAVQARRPRPTFFTVLLRALSAFSA